MTETRGVRLYRDDDLGIRAADDPDIEVLAEVLRLRKGQARANDPFRRVQARRLLPSVREFNNRIARRTPSLDEAWRAVEAVLPPGWAINLLWGTVTEERWGANAGPWPSQPGDPQTYAGGPTPAAALQALRDKLVAG